MLSSNRIINLTMHPVIEAERELICQLLLLSIPLGLVSMMTQTHLKMKVYLTTRLVDIIPCMLVRFSLIDM